jgi:hypothetical protein
MDSQTNSPGRGNQASHGQDIIPDLDTDISSFVSKWRGRSTTMELARDPNTTKGETQSTLQDTMPPKYIEERALRLEEYHDARGIEQGDSEQWPEVFADIDTEDISIEKEDIKINDIKFERPRFVVSEALEPRDVLTRDYMAFLEEAEIVEDIKDSEDPEGDEKLVKQPE